MTESKKEDLGQNEESQRFLQPYIAIGAVATKNLMARILRPIWADAIVSLLKRSEDDKLRNFAPCFENFPDDRQDEIAERLQVPLSEFVRRIEQEHEKFGMSVSVPPPPGTCACGKAVQDCPHSTKK